ncbi:MAG: hypothetical protein L0Y56_02755 [Nitrospira sp.]|nr:hypothetical protein [Nitrospira sp.]
MTENISTSTEGKALIKSKTFLGILLTGLSAVVPELMTVPGVAGKVGLGIGLLLAFYGRLSADKPIKSIL